MGLFLRVTPPVNEHPGSTMTRPEKWDSQDCVSIRDFAERRVPLKELAKRVWKEVDADNVPGLAAQTSYYFVLVSYVFSV
jgi:hypothetical protein